MLDTHAVDTPGFRPLTCFGGFPYLVTKVVPGLYHIIVLPDELDEDRLVDIARRQASANVLETCLVCAADSAFYIDTAGARFAATHRPRAG
jgi:hypothetical protein